MKNVKEKKTSLAILVREIKAFQLDVSGEEARERHLSVLKEAAQTLLLPDKVGALWWPFDCHANPVWNLKIAITVCWGEAGEWDQKGVDHFTSKIYGDSLCPNYKLP